MQISEQQIHILAYMCLLTNQNQMCQAIDVWNNICVSFVFLALLEYALVNYAARADARYGTVAIIVIVVIVVIVVMVIVVTVVLFLVWSGLEWKGSTSRQFRLS